jgi:hypothetical protein
VCGIEQNALRELLHRNTNIAQSRSATVLIHSESGIKHASAPNEAAGRSVQGESDVHKGEKFE